MAFETVRKFYPVSFCAKKSSANRNSLLALSVNDNGKSSNGDTCYSLCFRIDPFVLGKMGWEVDKRILVSVDTEGELGLLSCNNQGYKPSFPGKSTSAYVKLRVPSEFKYLPKDTSMVDLNVIDYVADGVVFEMPKIEIKSPEQSPATEN